MHLWGQGLSRNHVFPGRDSAQETAGAKERGQSRKTCAEKKQEENSSETAEAVGPKENDGQSGWQKSGEESTSFSQHV